MNVRCAACETVYRVDPDKVPAGGVKARCTVCSEVIDVRLDGAEMAPTAPSNDAGRATAAPIRAAMPPRPTPPQPRRVTPVRPASRPRVTRPIFGPGPSAPPTPVAPPEPIALPTEPVVAAPEPVVEPLTPVAVPPEPFIAPPPEEPAGPTLVPPDEEPVEELAPPDEAPSARPSAPVFRPAPGAPATEPPVPSTPEVAPLEPVAPVTERKAPVNPFLARDPRQKARRLARALVSDMIVYQPEKRQQALAAGNIKEAFEEEIQKSWEEYVDQVGAELANSTTFFKEALNEILAGGQQIF